MPRGDLGRLQHTARWHRGSVLVVQSPEGASAGRPAQAVSGEARRTGAGLASPTPPHWRCGPFSVLEAWSPGVILPETPPVTHLCLLFRIFS